MKVVEWVILLILKRKDEEWAVERKQRYFVFLITLLQSDRSDTVYDENSTDSELISNIIICSFILFAHFLLIMQF